ncbi:MAG: hypothetical protein KAW92_00590 [Candidatus Cloacimonetes bacterium]|nr:hypothetical protein [Candidatus Cloacimonadota bacterium]
MFKSFTITSKDIGMGFRFEPSFYYYSTVLKRRNLDKGIEYIKLDDLSEKISDGEHSHIPRQKEKGIRYLYGRNIKEGIVNFDPISDAPYISEKNYKDFKRTHIKQNDLLLTIVGTIGKSALYKTEYIGKAGIPRHIAKITIKKDSHITPEFITAFFRSKIGKWQLLNITTGNIQPLLSIKNIRTLDIPKTNRKFIKNITKLEDKALENEINALSLLQQAQQFFYQILNVDFSKIKKENFYPVNLSNFKNIDLWTPKYSCPLYINTLKAIQKKWQTVTFGEIAVVKKGDEVGSDNYNKYLDKKDTDVPFIRTSDLVNYEVDQFPDFYIPEEIYQELNQDIKAGDVLFNNDGKIGLVAMLTAQDKVILQSHIRRLRLKREAIEKYNLTREYLFLVLSIKEIAKYQADRYTVIQSTIPTISNHLIDIEIPILDKDSIDEITKLVRQAFKLKNEKKKLIQEVREEIDSYFEI